MLCNIKWNYLTLHEWETHFCQIPRSTLLQSHEYAQVYSKVHFQKPHGGLIEINGRQAGLVQILESGVLKNALHTIILDRGPLWFAGFGENHHYHAFIDTFMNKFPRRLGRRIRFIPEIPESFAIDKQVQRYGLKKRGNRYQTIWLNLSQNLDDLNAGLKKNWRNTLSKSGRSDISIEWDTEGRLFPWLAKLHTLDSRKRGYVGINSKMLNTLAAHFTQNKKMLIGRALTGNKPIAAILIFCHGRSATYQIGWTSAEGRKTGAQNLLLWKALEVLKNKGILDFDLGGINDESAKGVKKFKEGMGGETVTLAGLYS